MPRSIARAKVNLTLSVGAVITDPASPHHAYHPLSSLVAFADYGDSLKINPAQQTTLIASGPFAQDVPGGEDNLIIRALTAVKAHADLPEFDIHLTKNLPVASGIGGGSADAAAMLRLLSSYAKLPPKVMLSIGASLGADIPACMTSQTCEMSGIGEALRPLPGLGQVAAVLVNPGKALSTAKVFSRYDKTDPPVEPAPADAFGSLMDIAIAGGNDLQASAEGLEPVISDVLALISAQSGCRAARMSGSGATCFGIFDNFDIANQAQHAIAHQEPAWWSRAVMLGDADAI